MSILIKSAKIVDAKSKFNGKIQDILIHNGKIQEISNNISDSKGEEKVVLKNLHVSPGWFDSSVCFGEPGLEERETLSNGSNTAAFSGFTDVVLNPETSPYLDTKADIIYVKSQKLPINIHPLGCLTKEAKSKELADLYEMYESGAVGFYDFKRPITNSNLIKDNLKKQMANKVNWTPIFAEDPPRWVTKDLAFSVLVPGGSG
mgnify:CR=1 FL=1